MCCVFGFLGPPWALFYPISQHTGVGLGFMLVDAHLSAPHHLTYDLRLMASLPVAILCAAFSGNLG